MDMRLAGISRSTTNFLIYLMDNGGKVTASMPAIAEKLGVCRRTVHLAVRDLRKRGVLAVDRHFEPNGRTAPSTYRVVG